MQKKIKVLQIGTTNWDEVESIPKQLDWNFAPSSNLERILTFEDTKSAQTFDAILFTDFSGIHNINCLNDIGQSYAVLFTQETLPNDPAIRAFLKLKLAQAVSIKNKKLLLEQIVYAFFDNQSGIKLGINMIRIAPTFGGSCKYEGNAYLELEGEFGKEFEPLAFWQKNIYVDPNKKIEVWPEFVKSADCELKISFFETINGSTDTKQSSWSVNEKGLESPIVIGGTHNETSGSFLNVIIYAKGSGKVKIGSLHYRWSRLGLGQFLLGGQRYADSKRQEFMYYFNPGDMKPPLNVYFAGYRSLEGFEGYFMMKKMNAPFILLSDPRLEGGAFYLGSEEFEKKIKTVITDSLHYLGFDNSQLILSGISMGTFGALYYGSKLRPHAIIAGKPLLNVGTIATNGRILRPQEFDTALDLLRLISGESSQAAADRLNKRFWDAFSKTDFKDTIVAAAYMKNDDYDRYAFRELVEKLQRKNVKVIGRGYIGRHNDNTSAIVNWFLTQYRYILKNDFGRK
ncbi:accessory secretory protein Asp2 [Liquorilactobacillus aquaticus DSM 21051]|uniref:Accessory secretory protein Asp2 n=1 Tax=Liquorilactobacillus aquaticus DSM 21051 TaxID=1423725 RepID=A0A0R2CV38_9LACO|nr:accessory secretory protein Asp2 [Liquorilactobacillus aquaticus DSM 21051]